MRTAALCSFVFAAVAATACGREPNSNPPLAATGVGPLKSLHRGELAAVETYRQAIEKEGSAAGELSSLRSDHQDAAEKLGSRVAALGGVADAASGAWGDFAKAVEGTAKIFGNKAALAALKAGEKMGIDDYERALTDTKVDSDSKNLIRSTLLPRQRAHVETLDRLMDGKAASSDTANR